MGQLITSSDLHTYRPLDFHTHDERIDPYINEAEKFDLKEWIGDSFSYQVMKNYDTNNSDKWKLLVEGESEYTYNDELYTYEGIKPGLCYMAIARFVKNNSINLNQFGISEVITEETKAPSTQRLNMYISSIESVGGDYMREVIKYLNRKIETYPEYENGCGGNRSGGNTGGFRIRGVGRNNRIINR